MNRQSMTATARANAIRRLIDAHLEEYEQMHAEERVACGLPAEVGSSGLADENRRLRRRIAELERELEA